VASSAASLAAGNAETRHEIAFTSFAPLDTDLFIADADGSNAKPYLSHPELDSNASFSNDSRWIVFTSRRGGSSDIYRARVDGSGLEALVTDPAYDDQAALSPDGKALAFVSSRSGQADIWRLDLRTKKLRNLTQHASGDFRPSWSPDGRWIAFTSDRDSEFPRMPAKDFALRQTTELYLVRIDGGEPRRLTQDGQIAGSPVFSPDGKRLAFYSARLPEFVKFNGARRASGTTQIESLDVATGERVAMTAGNGEKWSPRWLGTERIGFVSRAPAGGIEFTRGAAGVRGDFRHASWSPDGKRVVFDRDVDSRWPPNRAWPSRDTRFALRRVGVFPTFSPDGKHFAVNEGMTGTLSRSLLIANADGTPGRTLYSDPGDRNAVAADWAARGDRIAFGLGRFLPNQQGGPVFSDIALIRPDGTGFELLTDGKTSNGFPALSPDGGQVVYRRFDGKRRSLVITRVDTHETRELIGGDAHYNFPAWSPDGARIAFSSDMDGEGDFDVYSIRTDGADLRRLTRSPWNDAHNRWSPDGQWIVFATGRGGFKDEAALHIGNPQSYGEIAVMRADGSDVRVLTDDQFEDGTPTWIR
jgi:Tol biopolymer transport system component